MKKLTKEDVYISLGRSFNDNIISLTCRTGLEVNGMFDTIECNVLFRDNEFFLTFDLSELSVGESFYLNQDEIEVVNALRDFTLTHINSPMFKDVYIKYLTKRGNTND